jgi:ComF family protein
MKHFWGRVPISYGAALLTFQKEGMVQEMVHALKYRYKRDVGSLLGAFAARYMIESGKFNYIDCIIPVPISSKRLKKRGYNQAQIFGEGISKEINAPIQHKVLIKIRDTGTQTARSRQDRMEKVANSFSVKKKALIKGRHVLLVDDVITTGATLESCASLLLKEGARSISCITIAIATE